MISTNGLTLRYGKRVLFEDVTIKFTPGNCYGLIGANGAGKSTFLKILSGEIEPTSGAVVMPSDERLALLRQDHFAFDQYSVLDTVIMGHQTLYAVMKEKDAIYAKPDFSDADGVRAAELESTFAELNGWNAESEAATLLAGLGIPTSLHATLMKDLDGAQKVRVLLAQALFGNPDVLLLDEPTNHLDTESILWLEEFLATFENTVIVVSHDRHFLDQVCTHIADIDFSKISLYTGNYSFWLESSQLALEQKRNQNKRMEEKVKELQAFVQRFSANASKSRQATSRKKLLEKITIDDIKPSSRKYPHILFKPEREAGKDLLKISHLRKTIDGELVFDKINVTVNKGDKIAIISRNPAAPTAFMQVLMGESKADSGEFHFGITTSTAYFPKDNTDYFKVDMNLIDWLRQYSADKDETYIRGFLGRMLFSGEETLKKASVLSGGEKVRCMLARMMLQNANVLVLDEPTNHLDLESITALNNGLKAFPGTILFTSHDIQFVETIATRILELTPLGVIDRDIPYTEYLVDAEVKAERERLYCHPFLDLRLSPCSIGDALEHV